MQKIIGYGLLAAAAGGIVYLAVKSKEESPTNTTSTTSTPDAVVKPDTEINIIKVDWLTKTVTYSMRAGDGRVLNGQTSTAIFGTDLKDATIDGYEYSVWSPDANSMYLALGKRNSGKYTAVIVDFANREIRPTEFSQDAQPSQKK